MSNNNIIFAAGARRNEAPRAIGEIIDRVETNDVGPFGRGCHQWIAKQQGKEVRE